ncbi:hypothetical protein C8Q77DRAFT_322456 [Trametes polyzona]|nr:hypothetical protein C8Q77DRAFT_322456 [Trametes polyzona]
MSAHAASQDMPYVPVYASLVEPTIYGSRMPRLLARTVDGGSSPSSISTPSSSGSSSDHSNGGHPAVNPAIPALIAVAVFVLCVLVVIKGIHSLRGNGVTPVYRKPLEEEEKPRMYEVSLGRHPVSPCAPPPPGEGWSQMMPVAVEYLPPLQPRSTSPSRSRGPSPLRPPPRVVAPATRGSRSLSRDSFRSSWSSFPEKRAGSPSTASEDPARMRVAVIIAMPSPSASPSPERTDSTPASPAPAYLGLAHV